MSEGIKALKRTALYSIHLEAGAKMVPFSGWEMPVQYSGIIEEHMHTREKAGLFDICHMGELFLKGPTAQEDIERLITCRIDDMCVGKCRYGFLLNEDGCIIDDLIVFKISGEEYMLVVNAGTSKKDIEWIRTRVSTDTEFSDESENIAKLDIQGPLAPEIMSSLAGEKVIDDLKRYYFTNVEIEGVKVLLSRTGYTGEPGYELFFPVESADKLWTILTGFNDVMPVGLGARDTLRMEMGYSLYGNDIDEARTPVEANLARFIFLEKDFIGKKKILKKVETGTDFLLAGFICEGRRSARSHFKVISGNEEVGEVTSGGFSPCLKKGIGLCYILKDLVTEGREVLLTDGKTEVKARIKSIPLYEH